MAYFYNNLFLYTIGNDKTFLMALIRNLYEGIKNVLSHSTLSSALIGTGLVVMIKKEDKTEILSYLILGFLPSCWCMVEDDIIVIMLSFSTHLHQ